MTTARSRVKDSSARMRSGAERLYSYIAAQHCAASWPCGLSASAVSILGGMSVAWPHRHRARVAGHFEGSDRVCMTSHRLPSASLFSTTGFPWLWGRTVSFLRFSVPKKGFVSSPLHAVLCIGVLMPQPSQRGQGALPRAGYLMGKRQEGLLPHAAPSFGDFLASIL